VVVVVRRLVGTPHKIEQVGLPTTCMWHPRFPGEYEDRIITASTELKVGFQAAPMGGCRRGADVDRWAVVSAAQAVERRQHLVPFHLFGPLFRGRHHPYGKSG
jgi:hypothetical protein